MYKNLHKIALANICITLITVQIMYAQVAAGSAEPIETGIGNLGNICIWNTYDFASACLAEIKDIENAEYNFFIDEETGNLMYGDPDNKCNATELSCIQFCNNYDPENIISANASIFTNENDLDEDMEEIFEISSNDNPFETAQMGKWNIKSTYIYKTDISNIYDDVKQVYDAGIFTDFSSFNWYNTNRNDGDKWINVNTTNFFSTSGKPLEETNSMDISSVAKYGYDNKLVYLVAYNSDYESVLFESFEYNYSNTDEAVNYFEEIFINTQKHSIVNTQFHSGKQSVQLGGFEKPIDIFSGVVEATYDETDLPLFYNKNIGSQIKKDGFVVKIWVKSSGTWPSISLEENSGLSLFTTAEFVEVAKVGEWKLFEAKVTDWNLSTLGLHRMPAATEFGATIVFKYYTSTPDPSTLDISTLDLSSVFAQNNSTLPSIYVDDIRMQPLKAEMSTYVYDPSTFKLLNQFNDQHFGIFYQYNKEGKLIRMLRETERGLKMIKETQYNIPASSR